MNLLISPMLTRPFFVDEALLLARLTLGLCFVVHGLGKLGVVGPGNLSGFTAWLASLGLPFPAVQARLAMLAELVGGALIAIGLWTRFGFFVCFLTMVMAATVGHKGGGYLITNNPPGFEYALNLALLCLVFLLLGPGIYSVDAWLGL